MDIQGCRALVVGGASGLGEATVRALHARGAQVTIADLEHLLRAAWSGADPRQGP